MIACRFEEFTFDTPRNRLVRAAFDAIASRIDHRLLAHECRRLAGDLGQHGSGLKPSRAELSADRIARHDSDDLLMVTLARLIFDLVLPTEDAGDRAIIRVEKDVRMVRHLFEKAIGNFYAAELLTSGWKVQPGQASELADRGRTPGIPAILPGMITDIIF